MELTAVSDGQGSHVVHANDALECLELCAIVLHRRPQLFGHFCSFREVERRRTAHLCCLRLSPGWRIFENIIVVKLDWIMLISRRARRAMRSRSSPPLWWGFHPLL